MERDEFWGLIDSAVDDRNVMRERLKAMSEAELVDFYATVRGRADVLSDEKYWEHFEQSVSEDDHDDIAQWVVEQGSRYWKDVAYNPEKFPTELPDDDDGTSYSGMAAEEYEARYGEMIRDPDDPPPANA